MTACSSQQTDFLMNDSGHSGLDEVHEDDEVLPKSSTTVLVIGADCEATHGLDNFSNRNNKRLTIFAEVSVDHICPGTGMPRLCLGRSSPRRNRMRTATVARKIPVMSPIGIFSGGFEGRGGERVEVSAYAAGHGPWHLPNQRVLPLVPDPRCRHGVAYCDSRPVCRATSSPSSPTGVLLDEHPAHLGAAASLHVAAARRVRRERIPAGQALERELLDPVPDSSPPLP